ncbi:MAG: nickel-dependent lactate racemase [Terriglobia bacterium]
MQIALSYADIRSVEVPQSNVLAVLAPAEAWSPREAVDLLEEALDSPIGSSQIEQLASPSSKVLVLSDDITRQTPAAILFPGILRRIESAGVARANVKVLVAAGTHAHMTRDELERKLGADTLAKYSVSLHHWRDQEQLHAIGALSDGTVVAVNRMLSEADLVIGLGQIVPHRVMGFTGGASIVQPGVSGSDVTGHTHWLSALYPGSEIMGFADNPVRREVEQVAKLAGLRFIVNVVMDRHERVVHVVAGDPVLAHRKGAEYARKIFGVAQPSEADVVIAESYPADYDLWQAAKGIYAAELSVRKGGVVILVTPCFHGVSDEHPEVERFGYPGVEEVKRRVECGEISDLVAAAHLGHVGRVIRDRARGIMVSKGIPPAVQKHLGFTPAATVEEALDIALATEGAGARVAVLQQGGHVLPLVGQAAS